MCILIGHGSNSSFPVESWNEGDQVYLCRVRASISIVPTKFLGQSHDIKVLSDGSSIWPFYFGYSANWGFHKYANPPHSGYGFCLLSSKLVLTSNFTNQLIDKKMLNML